jgi:hypothetical protein
MLGAMAALGCSTHTANRPFTEDWAYVIQHEKPPQSGGDIVLMGGFGGAPKTALHLNEEGTPELKIGDKSRWSTGVSIDGGAPEVNVKYKVAF